MEIYYINLKRRADRNAAFLRHNSHLKRLHRVEAVEAGELEIPRLISEGTIAQELPCYSPASLGNALTQKRIWEDCIRNGTGGTVAEDDAVFNLHFEEKSAKVLASFAADWDLILWGWNFDSVMDVDMLEGLRRSTMIFDGEKLGSQIQAFQEMEFESTALRLYGTFGTVAYTASLKGMKLLLEKCFPLRHEQIDIPSLRRRMWNAGIDTLLNKHYPEMKAYVAVPPLVWTENDKSTSDIPPVPEARKPAAG
jgi:glycosyl transferase family 25